MWQHAREAVQESGGIAEITLDQMSQTLLETMTATVTPSSGTNNNNNNNNTNASHGIPESIRQALHSQIRRACGFGETQDEK